MTFDSIVALLEQRLLPDLQQEEAILRATGIYKEIEGVSLRHADIVHAVGIRCHPKWAAGALEYLSFIAAVTAPSRDVRAKADIQWSDSFDFRTGTGYLKKEVAPCIVVITSEVDIDRFIRGWQAMSPRFRQVSRKGSPSARLVRWLRGAPRDTYGRKTEANKAPEPTRTAVPR